MEGLYSALRNLTVKIEKYPQDNQQRGHKFIAIQRPMGGMVKVLLVDFGEIINAVVRRSDASLGGVAKDQATSLNEGVKK